MSNIKIVHEPNGAEPFLVLEKPAGLASAPLQNNDTKNALSQAIKLFPEIKNVRGKKEIEYGLLHRIDTATRGLLLFATNQEFYDHILRAQDDGAFVKYYFAECNIDDDNAKKLGGFPERLSLQKLVERGASSMPDASGDFEITSYFRPYGKGRHEVRPVMENSNAAAYKKIGAKKLYSTKIVSLEKAGGIAKIRCSIEQGFRHQVRCHLAWVGVPVIGDALYNQFFRASMPNGFDSSNSIEHMRFFATGLQFPDLYLERIIRFQI